MWGRISLLVNTFHISNTKKTWQLLAGDEGSITSITISILWDTADLIPYSVASQFQESIFTHDQFKKYELWTVFHNPPPLGAPHYHLLEAHVQCTKYMVVGGGGGVRRNMNTVLIWVSQHGKGAYRPWSIRVAPWTKEL